MTTRFYRDCLQEELAKRCRADARYSLRAFARALGINDGALSQIIAGKRAPSKRTAERLVEGLNLGPGERRKFWISLARHQTGRTLKKKPQFFSKIALRSIATEIQPKAFSLISEWYYPAILELSYLPEFRSEPKFIARRLRISLGEAALAIEKLRRHGYLTESNGQIVKTNPHLATAERNLTSGDLRKHQRQMIQKASVALEEIPIAARVNTGMTMAIDVDLLPQARRLIDEFSDRLCELLESGKREEVYQLSVSLFPLSQNFPKTKE